MININDVVAANEYDFLRTNEHLKNRILFLTFGGSHAYGTNIATSDIDIRGCALNSPSDILGTSNFEQVLDNTTDTVIYSFNKLIPLLCNCNPNVIEILGCKPEHYCCVSEIGKELLDNKKMFLSKKAAASFGGYATCQLRRLENALARDHVSQGRKEEHIAASMENAMQTFQDRYKAYSDGAINLYTDESDKDDFEKEIFVDIDIKRCPIRDLTGMVSELNSVARSYDKLNKRNTKKDDAHLNKHAMHLIRLYLMCLDILENEEIVTYREKDHDLLMSIRSGKYQNEDGTFAPEFFEMVNALEDRMSYAKKNTSLPEKPDYKKVEEFVMSINRRSIDV